MYKTTIYGLPLNPTSLLEQLDGASFCVSYGTREKLGKQLDQAIRLVGEDGILLVDNGAYTHWKQGGAMTPEYVEGFEIWAQDILDRCPQAIAVIPDVIMGSVEQNAKLVEETLLDLDRCMPIWHMHEPISYLIDLCERFAYVGFGSTADKPGSKKWHARIKEAFAAIDQWLIDSEGAYVRPRIHMMRAQNYAHLYGFDSSDSTNVGMNHNRQLRDAGETVPQFAARIDSKIQASAGLEAEHQIKRPLLDHEEQKKWEENWALEMQLRAAGFDAVADEMLEDRYARSIERCAMIKAQVDRPKQAQAEREAVARAQVVLTDTGNVIDASNFKRARENRDALAQGFLWRD